MIIAPEIKILVEPADLTRCDPECGYNADSDGEYCYLFNESIYGNKRCEECLKAKIIKGE